MSHGNAHVITLTGAIDQLVESFPPEQKVGISSLSGLIPVLLTIIHFYYKLITSNYWIVIKFHINLIL